MKFFSKIILVMITFVSLLECKNKHEVNDIHSLVLDGFKLYEIKSARIEYDIVSVTDTSKTFQKLTLTFDNYGYREVVQIEGAKGSKATTFKELVARPIKDSLKKIHELKYSNGANVYLVDFEKNKILRKPNFELLETELVDLLTKKVMKKEYGKKIATTKVLGYECDVWEKEGNKVFFYKKIPLKLKFGNPLSDELMIASKIEFDIDVDDEIFKLPNLPIYNYKNLKLSRNMLDEMDFNETRDFLKIVKNPSLLREKDWRKQIPSLKSFYENSWQDIVFNFMNLYPLKIYF